MIFGLHLVPAQWLLKKTWSLSLLCVSLVPRRSPASLNRFYQCCLRQTSWPVQLWLARQCNGGIKIAHGSQQSQHCTLSYQLVACQSCLGPVSMWKTLISRYRNFHHKDKTVERTFYPVHGANLTLIQPMWSAYPYALGLPYMVSICPYFLMVSICPYFLIW